MQPDKPTKSKLPEHEFVDRDPEGKSITRYYLPTPLPEYELVGRGPEGYVLVERSELPAWTREKGYSLTPEAARQIVLSAYQYDSESEAGEYERNKDARLIHELKIENLKAKRDNSFLFRLFRYMRGKK